VQEPTKDHLAGNSRLSHLSSALTPVPAMTFILDFKLGAPAGKEPNAGGSGTFWFGARDKCTTSAAKLNPLPGSRGAAGPLIVPRCGCR
jgi:hypothetical protein